MFGDGLLLRYAPREAIRTLAASGSLDAWLHARERNALRRYRDPDAREAWLAGRIVAKQLVLDALCCEPRSRCSSKVVQNPTLDALEAGGSLDRSDVPKGQPRVARRFIAGEGGPLITASPEGTTETEDGNRSNLSRPFGTAGPSLPLHPGDESPGYSQSSLRDAARAAGSPLRNAAVSHAFLRVADIEICSRDRAGRHVRPWVNVAGRRLPWCLSISHTTAGVLAALSLNPRVRVGVDLAPVQDRSPGFLRVWFTEREQERLRSRGPREIACYWAAKEAAYKAVNDGQSFAPRQVEIIAADETGRRLTCRVGGCGPCAECLVETASYDDEVGAIALWQRPRRATHPLNASRARLVVTERTTECLAAGPRPGAPE
ncbi:MAG TPA: 4'-phosphopantetheinyl transferase superfamily protein [Planctomycetaceae bacterium]|nr:4'-phosphopantetheinyl transferase superfamily protein [Planctomycetaceae bacterium]